MRFAWEVHGTAGNGFGNGWQRREPQGHWMDALWKGMRRKSGAGKRSAMDEHGQEGKSTARELCRSARELY